MERSKRRPRPKEKAWPISSTNSATPLESSSSSSNNTTSGCGPVWCGPVQGSGARQKKERRKESSRGRKGGRWGQRKRIPEQASERNFHNSSSSRRPTIERASEPTSEPEGGSRKLACLGGAPRPQAHSTRTGTRSQTDNTDTPPTPNP